MLAPARLESLLQVFPRLTIALVGDLFLDRYLDLEPGLEELSIETGLEAYQVTRVRNSAGALGTVMNNLAALGVGLLVPITVIGDDGHGFDLRNCLAALPIDNSHIIRRSDRLTPTYTKPMRYGDDGVWHELNRLDVRTHQPLSSETTIDVCQRILAAYQTSDALIVLDQINETDLGVVNEAVREFVSKLAQHDPHKPVFVDSRQHLGRFSGGILKGNRSEVLRAAQEADYASDVELALTELATKTGQPAFCTVGEQGTLVAKPARPATLIPGYRVSGAVDIVGAGDSATSGILASLLAGASPEEAAAVGNLVASITVQQLGTTGVATPAQLLARCREIDER